MTSSHQRKSWNGSAKTVSLALAFAIMLGGCAHISLKTGKNGKGETPPPPPSTTSGAPKAQEIDVTGDWQFGFKFNSITLQSDVHLDQQGNTFTGSGKDSQNGTPFSIEGGEIEGGQVTFYKKYAGGSSPDIQYTGTLEMANDGTYKGPYMHGEYQTAKKGTVMTDLWEAEMIQAGAPQAQAQPAPQPAPAPTPAPAPPPASSSAGMMLDRTPDLSGKWNVAFKYNFDHVHSTMFLEQMGDKITGHGVDHQTKQKFVIEKGWYHFPKITLIRKYPKQTTPKPKGKGTISVPERTTTFRGRVSIVNDKDYHGPYITGETQGGGPWEAELYR